MGRGVRRGDRKEEEERERQPKKNGKEKTLKFWKKTAESKSERRTMKNSRT